MATMITWTSKNIDVDTETGEIIIKKELDNYTKIKSHKKTEFNATRTAGVTIYTNEYKRNKYKQSKLFE